MTLLVISLVLLIAAIIAGGWLWWPTRRDVGSRAGLGSAFATAVITTAIVSALFFSLQERDEATQRRLETADANAQRKLSDRDQAAQAKLQQTQSLYLQLTLNRDLAGVDLSNQDLRHQDLAQKDLANADLYGVDLTDARLLRTDLASASLNLATLDNANMRRATLNHALLEGARLRGTTLDEAHLFKADLGVVALNGIRRASDLSGASLINARMQGACLARADLRDARLGGANLEGADLDGADLRGAHLIHAGVPVNLQGAAIAGAKLDPGSRVYLDHPLTLTPRESRLLQHGGAMPRRAHTGTIEQIYDGETAYIKPLGWARLIGLTVPNLDVPYGHESRQFLASAVAGSKTVRYELGALPRERRPGGTGRWLVYVWTAKGMFVNEELLAHGLGIRRPARLEGPRYTALFDAAVVRAKTTGSGVWSVCPEPPQ